MRAPWIYEQWQKSGWWSILARPLSALYGLGLHISRYQGLQKRQHTKKPATPVVVVGNLYVGGTGKTPVILRCIEALRTRGWNPGLVSRGYGTKSSKTPAVGRGQLSADQFGDEPAMIAQKTDIAVAVFSDRHQAILALQSFDPSINVILSDDGLQHWPMHRDIEILVEDNRGIGNGLLLPAGPLREPAQRREQVDAITKRITDAKPKPTRVEQLQVFCEFRLEICTLRHLQTGEIITPDSFQAWRQSQASLLALAGIGVPERFFAQLRTLGLHPDRTEGLADHADLSQTWLSEQPESTILLTEKDAVRLGTLPWSQTHLKRVRQDESDNPDLLSTHAQLCQDARVWVAVADTQWGDDVLFDWLDARLHDIRAQRQ